MLVGIDDTDSKHGMCTTYLASRIIKDFNLKTTPRLIRLNPNIPYKTRGNGAVSFRIPKKSQDDVIEYVEKFSHKKEDGTNPGIAFLKKESDSKKLHPFYKTCLSEHVEIESAQKLADKIGAELVKFNNGRGIVGALASIGARLDLKTFELIAYRGKDAGGKRKVDEESVFSMDKKFFPKVFDTLDVKRKKILFCPRGADPVFCGIRGVSKKTVEDAWKIIIPLEEIEMVQVFETNQATDAHYAPKKISQLKPYDSVKLKGFVEANPERIEGGHVVFKIKDETGSIDCGAYKPTMDFRNTISKLLQGDVVEVFGGFSRYVDTLNLEKIHVKKIAQEKLSHAPTCCGKKMTSAGKEKGFKCRACGKKALKPVLTQVRRDISPGWFEVGAGARRHLARPLILDGLTSP
ncbi:MAG TPA: DUF1743 domain-containing protein [Candidatus Altiarchaeales archaeon]|nr:DUF1743 domain-containing protein [Candidatus Altiarchaeales archaeon]